mmetsp:Transcript_27561/g.66430  ORF Transcript_27561/g.66430 Transcript_27561/m.66430 type:complete len:301 (+) Transcript_27561:316-1218(+)
MPSALDGSASWTRATGRSSHLGCGMATTQDISTSGNSVIWFSMSMELIHSPPDLMTSLERSQIMNAPSSSTRTTSPVMRYPLWNFSAATEASCLKYSEIIVGPFTSNSPCCPWGTSSSKFSGFASLYSIIGTGIPALHTPSNRSCGVFFMSLCLTSVRPMDPSGLVSVIPHPWMNSTPRVSRYHCIISFGGADPPQVRYWSSILPLSSPIFPLYFCSAAARTPCQIVGTPVEKFTFQSSMICNKDAGSMKWLLNTTRDPDMSRTKGTPQDSTWNIGTTGSTVWYPVIPSWSAPEDTSVCK